MKRYHLKDATSCFDAFWEQGCQMVCFQTKNPNFGKKFWGPGIKNVVIFYDNLEYFTDFGKTYGLVVYFVVIWYIFYALVCLDQEKSGNPVWEAKKSFFSDLCVLYSFG
jgi:hypothetical protein